MASEIEASVPALEDREGLDRDRRRPGTERDVSLKRRLARRPMWMDFVAGGTAGTTAAFCTAPLELMKTRLQSSFFRNSTGSSQGIRGLWVGFKYVPFLTISPQHSSIVKNEGFLSLWNGIGPNIAGVLPARAIYFSAYAKMKEELTLLNHGKENSFVHLLSAASAGILNTTITCPIWIVKTRMQLQQRQVAGAIGSTASTAVYHHNAFACFSSVLKKEGVRGLYRGLMISYIGVAEGTIQWTLYEQFKKQAHIKDEEPPRGFKLFLLAGTAKLIASLSTYPHEVIRTRQRQSADSRYRGIVQSFKLIAKEEGARGLYGGLFPHLLRTVPNSAIMFLVYEIVSSKLERDFLEYGLSQ